MVQVIVIRSLLTLLGLAAGWGVLWLLGSWLHWLDSPWLGVGVVVWSIYWLESRWRWALGRR